jgi:hypothetical protein
MENTTLIAYLRAIRAKYLPDESTDLFDDLLHEDAVYLARLLLASNDDEYEQVLWEVKTRIEQSKANLHALMIDLQKLKAKFAEQKEDASDSEELDRLQEML